MRTLFTLISVPFSEDLHPHVRHPHSPRRASAGATEVALRAGTAMASTAAASNRNETAA